MYKGRTVSVIIPCHNEEDGLGKVLPSVPRYVDELIVVDNCSTDQTAQVAQAHGAKVVREEVRGYGKACRKGYARAQGDLLVTLDGDDSYPMEALASLLEAYDRFGVKFLSASRFPQASPSIMDLKNYLGNQFLSGLMSLLFFCRVRDSQSGMWILAREALQKMKLESDGMAFSEEIKAEAIRDPTIGFREVPVPYSFRVGQSKLRPWRDGWSNLLFLFKKRFFR